MPHPQDGRPKALVVVVLFLAASIVFFLLAFTTHVPSYPVLAKCSPLQSYEDQTPKTGLAAASACEGIMWANSFAIGGYDNALIPFQAKTETAGAFLLLSVVAFIWLVKWPVPSLFRRRISLPKVVRVGALFVTLAGSLVFVLAALLDFSNTNPLVALLAGALPVPVSHPSLYSFASSAANAVGLNFLVTGWTNQIAGYGSSYSLAPFCALVLAAVGVMVFRLNHGVLPALKDGVTLFAAPVLVFFELGLGYFVPAMTFQELSQVASWEVSSIPLVSNWLVLVVSSGFFVLGLTQRWLGRVSDEEACENRGVTGSRLGGPGVTFRLLGCRPGLRRGHGYHNDHKRRIPGKEDLGGFV